MSNVQLFLFCATANVNRRNLTVSIPQRQPRRDCVEFGSAVLKKWGELGGRVVERCRRGAGWERYGSETSVLTSTNLTTPWIPMDSCLSFCVWGALCDTGRGILCWSQYSTVMSFPVLIWFPEETGQIPFHVFLSTGFILKLLFSSGMSRGSFLPLTWWHSGIFCMLEPHAKAAIVCR